MMNVMKIWTVGLLTLGCLLVVADRSPAQEKKEKKDKKEEKKKEDKKDKKPYEKHDANVLNNALRDVINAGVKMFNEQGDYAGTYRLYQGSLMSVRPFLAADLQKRIDTGLARAEGLGNYADRAYELRSVLDDIRSSLKGEKIGMGTPVGDKGDVSGKLRLEGKAVAGGYFVTLVGGDGKKFSSAIQKDGSFTFKTPIPTGDYRIAIEPVPSMPGIALPKRYASEGSSSLAVRVHAGKQSVELNLVK